MTERPKILLLPGNMCGDRMWDAILPALDGWPVARPVLLENSIGAMADTCLVNHSGPLIPIGFSMGAIVALAIAQTAPERVAAIGLIDVNPGPDRPDRAAHRLRQQRDVLANGVEQTVIDELKPSYFAHENRSHAHLRSLVLEMARDLGPKVFLAQSEALRTRPDHRTVLSALDVPKLLAVGEQDTLCPPQLHRQLANGLSNCELHVVPGAGHMLPLEQPAKLATHLSNWLIRIEKEILCPAQS